MLTVDGVLVTVGRATVMVAAPRPENGDVEAVNGTRSAAFISIGQFYAARPRSGRDRPSTCRQDSFQDGVESESLPITTLMAYNWPP